MAQQDPRKVKTVPPGYVKEIRDGKTVYVKSTTTYPEVIVTPDVRQPDKVKSKPSVKPGKVGPKKPNPTRQPGNVTVQPPVQSEDVVMLEEPKVSEYPLYGSVTTRRNILTDRSVPGQYTAVKYADPTGKFATSEDIVYLDAVTGKPIAQPSKEDYVNGKFTPRFLDTEIPADKGIENVFRPKQSGVTKEGKYDELLMPGTTYDKNPLGGLPVNAKVKVEGLPTSYTVQNYDEKGNPIKQTKVSKDLPEVGKKIDLTPITSEKFAKGGLVQKLAAGGTVKFNEGTPDGYGYSGAVVNSDAANQNPDKKGFNMKGASGIAGAIGSTYYSSQVPQNEGDAAYNAGMQSVGQIGPIGKVIQGGAAIGDMIGKPIRKKNEAIDPETGEYKNLQNAQVAGAIGAASNPYKNLTTVMSDKDASAKTKLIAGLSLGSLQGDYYKEKQAGNVKRLNQAKAEVQKQNILSKQEQAVAARNAEDFNTKPITPYNVNDVKYDENGNIITPIGNVFKKGGLVQKLAKGGEIKGKGGPKDDKITAKVEDGSFVVPVENAEVAEELREKVLMKAPKVKANLNQKGGEKVKLSNGEHLFTPEEKEELLRRGVNVDLLAPNSDSKVKDSKSPVMFPKVVGYAEGGNIEDSVDPAKEKAKIAAEEAAIAKTKAELEANKKKAELEAATNKSIRERKAEREKLKKKYEQQVKDSETELKALEKSYEDYTKASSVPMTSTEKKIGAQIEKDPARIRSQKTDLLNKIEAAKSKYNKVKQTYDYVADDKNYDPTTGISKIELSKKAPTAPKVTPKAATAPEVKTETKAVPATPSLGKAKSKGIAGNIASTYTLPSTEPQVSDEVVVPKSDAEVKAAQSAENLAAENAKRLNDTSLTSANAAPTSAKKGFGSGLASTLSDLDPTAFIGLGQAAAGYKMLKGEKRPEWKAELDPAYQNALNRATKEAQYGFRPEDKFLAEQDIENARRDTAANAVNYAGGSGTTAFNLTRAGINDAWRNKLGLRSEDTKLRMDKQQYADQLAKEKASLTAANRRQAYVDAMGAFQQRQASGAELLGTGLANTIGAYRFNKDLQARKAADLASTAWSRDYGKTI